MHGLIGRLVANVGVDRAAAEMVVGIILPFRRMECAVENIATRIDRPRRSHATARRPQTNSNCSGMFGALDAGMAGRIRLPAARPNKTSAVACQVIGRTSQMDGEGAVGDVAGAVSGRFV